MPEPPCCGCGGWVVLHMVQTVVVADAMLAIRAEACPVRAIAAGLDSPPISTQLKTNMLTRKRFTVLSVVGHPKPDNPTMSTCYSRHSGMRSVVCHSAASP